MGETTKKQRTQKGYQQCCDELKLVKKELQESKRKYKMLSDNMIDGFAYHKMIFNKKGEPVDYEFLEINNRFEVLTGLRGKDIIGKKVKEVIPELEPMWVKKYGKVAMGKGSIRFESYSKPLDRWYSVYAYSDKKGYFTAIFEDISKYKRALIQLEKSEKLFRTLTQSSSDCIRLFDLEGRLRYINPAGEREHAQKEKNILGKNYISFFRKENKERIKQAVEKAKAGETIDLEFEHGEKFSKRDWCYTSVIPIKDKEKITGILIVSRDITAHKHHELHLQKKTSDLKKLNKSLVGREIKMIKLKEKIKQLQHQLQEKKHKQ